jgi:tRNA dimethylallyltransferase
MEKHNQRMQQQKHKPKIISLIGPTASGKSGLGILLAQKFNGEIISCDSRQVYKGLDIGSAKVTKEEQALIRHHLLDVTELPVEMYNEGKDRFEKDRFTAWEFQRLAYQAIDDILARGKLPILVGGTGLYSRCIVEGYSFEMDSVQPTMYNDGEINESMELVELQQLVRERGLQLNNSDFHNKRRLVRKLLDVGVVRESNPRYDVLQICLAPEKEVLQKRVIARVGSRLNEGIIEETQQLLADGVPAEFLQNLGLDYFWSVEVVQGRVSLDEYKNMLSLRHMQFIKKQITWFKREKNTNFLSSQETYFQDSADLITAFLGKK